EGGRAKQRHVDEIAVTGESELLQPAVRKILGEPLGREQRVASCAVVRVNFAFMAGHRVALKLAWVGCIRTERGGRPFSHLGNAVTFLLMFLPESLQAVRNRDDLATAVEVCGR